MGEAFPGAARGGRQDCKALAIEQTVVDPARVAAPVEGGVFFSLQQAVASEVVQVDQVGVPGEGGEALIG